MITSTALITTRATTTATRSPSRGKGFTTQGFAVRVAPLLSGCGVLVAGQTEWGGRGRYGSRAVGLTMGRQSDVLLLPLLQASSVPTVAPLMR